jgi:aspartyl-tRNA(Asn)/glutamyl-tRNA(Gln) amidotransferase subunit C
MLSSILQRSFVARVTTTRKSLSVASRRAFTTYVSKEQATWSLADSASTQTAAVQLSEADVARIAQLSNIKLSPQEVQGLHESVQSIVQWTGSMADVDTEGVAPMISPLQRLGTPLRSDVVTEGGDAAPVVANSKHTNSKFFTVPKVVDFEDS